MSVYQRGAVSHKNQGMHMKFLLNLLCNVCGNWKVFLNPWGWVEHAGDQLLFLLNGKVGADMQSNITLFSVPCLCFL